jgi:hypothetical protein
MIKKKRSRVFVNNCYWSKQGNPFYRIVGVATTAGAEALPKPPEHVLRRSEEKMRCEIGTLP